MATASEVLAFPYAYLQRIETPTNTFAKIELNLPEITVGRGKDNNFVIPDLLVSRKHVTFKTDRENGWLIESVGMNGTSVNNEVLPKNTPTTLKHLDKIEFGAGGKLVFKFHLKSVDLLAADASQGSFSTETRPSARDSPAAFRSFVQSRRSLERTLMEESVVLDQRLEEQTSKKNLLVREQQKLEEHSNKLRGELEAQFAQERKALEEKGQLEKSELQKEKAELEERMTKIFREFQEECNQKSLQLQQSVETANAEKTALLEQKEIIVQQLLREKQLLQDLLEEERRLKESAAAAQATAEAELANSREAIRRLEEEKKQLEERGSEGEVRFRQIEEALAEKQREMEDFQSRNLIGLDYYEMARINVEEGTVAVPEAQAAGPAPDVEAEIKRRVTEEMSETIENMATSLECNICSEPIIVAISLNCCHTFCQYCINQWKRNKNDCPSCRTPITSESRHHFIDNVIETMINKLPEEAKAQRRELVKQRADLLQRQVQPAPQPAANGVVRHVLQIPGLTGDPVRDRPIIIAHIHAENARIAEVIRGRLTPTPPRRQPAPRPMAPAPVVAAQAAPVAAVAQPIANFIRINAPQHQVVRPAASNNPAGQQPRAQVRFHQARPAVPAGQLQRVHVRLAQARPATAPYVARRVSDTHAPQVAARR